MGICSDVLVTDCASCGGPHLCCGCGFMNGKVNVVPLLRAVVALATDLGVESGLVDFEGIDLFSSLPHWMTRPEKKTT